MKINDSSNVIHFNFEDLSNELIHIVPDEFQDDISNIVKIDGEYYYAKIVSSKEMLNELIGTYYSNLIGGNSLQYRIGFNNGNIYALSKMFFERNFSYVYVADYFSPPLSFTTTNRNTISELQFWVETDNLKRLGNEKAIKRILQMSAVDIKMNQADRHSYNIILKINNGILDIEKTFDYGWSYEVYQDLDSQVFYKNPFILVKKDCYSLYLLGNMYPEFRRCLNILRDTTLGDVLRMIELDNGIKINNEDFNDYIKKDEEYSKVLRKI